MNEYIGKLIQIATPQYKGITNDHLDIRLSTNSISTIFGRRRDIPRIYSIYHRFDCDSTVPPKKDACIIGHPRSFDEPYTDTDLTLVEAIGKGLELAEEKQLVLYLQTAIKPKDVDQKNFWNEWLLREIIWHPEGWQPHEG